MNISKETLLEAELAASDDATIIKLNHDGIDRKLSRTHVYAAIGYMEARGETSVNWPIVSNCPCIPGCVDFPECQYSASSPP